MLCGSYVGQYSSDFEAYRRKKNRQRTGGGSINVSRWHSVLCASNVVQYSSKVETYTEKQTGKGGGRCNA